MAPRIIPGLPPTLPPESGVQSSSRRLQPSLRPCSTGDCGGCGVLAACFAFATAGDCGFSVFGMVSY